MAYALALLLPLLGALTVGLFGKALGERFSQWFTTGLVLLSAVISIRLFYNVVFQGQTMVVPLFQWINVASLKVAWAFKFDTLSVVMILVVTSVSAMVHLYSIGYMHEDPALTRFMAYLSLFTFFMLMLVTAPNLLQMFFGWEGVGLASYLLIGFWYEKDSANKAAMKAFIVNRVGDVSFALGLLLIYSLTHSLEFDAIFDNLDKILTTTWTFAGYRFSAVTIISLLLFGGAMGKSAQLGLHVWLPDAMEGPTPVSALIHAATMVTAGVFMMARVSPLLEHSDFALMVIACLGTATALFAGTVALTQNDIKRVIAYSTCSQLGYMFLAIGFSAYNAALFHLFTHAFFKALLFLGAGSVIHALSGEQDMQRMGGVWRYIPITYTLMWIGTLALTGFPFLAGFYSKDAILEAAIFSGTPQGSFLYGVGLLAALLTAVYSWRLMFLTFHGKTRANEKVLARIHESPPVMLIPLFVLAGGALLAGKLGVDLFMHHPTFWRKSLSILSAHQSGHAAHNPLYSWLPAIFGILGFMIAFYCYLRNTQVLQHLYQTFKKVYLFLHHKWYFDELYERIFVKPTWNLGRVLWNRGDKGLIDPYLPDGVAKLVQKASVKSSRLHTGYVFQYAIVMLAGVVLLSAWYIIQKVLNAHV